MIEDMEAHPGLQSHPFADLTWYHHLKFGRNGYCIHIDGLNVWRFLIDARVIRRNSTLKRCERMAPTLFCRSSIMMIQEDFYHEGHEGNAKSDYYLSSMFSMLSMVSQLFFWLLTNSRMVLIS
jgi:hypothetical protein